MAAARFFLALLLLTAGTASFAHADEGHAFDITTAAVAPRKVLNGGSNGLLASAASQSVSALPSTLEGIESVLNLNAPVLGASEIKKLSGFTNFERAISSGKDIIFFTTSTTSTGGCDFCSAMAWAFEFYANQSSPALAFYTVDIDVEDEIATEAGIDEVPAFIAYKDGKTFERLTVGFVSKLRDVIKKLTEA